jgi:hypothetical protein
MALVHVYRLLVPFDVIVGGNAVPQWASIVALIVTAVLALMVWKESRRA